MQNHVITSGRYIIDDNNASARTQISKNRTGADSPTMVKYFGCFVIFAERRDKFPFSRRNAFSSFCLFGDSGHVLRTTMTVLDSRHETDLAVIVQQVPGDWLSLRDSFYDRLGV